MTDPKDVIARLIETWRQTVSGGYYNSWDFGAGMTRCANELESALAALPSSPPPSEKTAEWVVQNCHMLARREIRRLEAWRKDGGDTTPIGMAVTAWEHVIRICEKSGVQQPGVLRDVVVSSPPSDACGCIRRGNIVAPCEQHQTVGSVTASSPPPETETPQFQLRIEAELRADRADAKAERLEREIAAETQLRAGTDALLQGAREMLDEERQRRQEAERERDTARADAEDWLLCMDGVKHDPRCANHFSGDPRNGPCLRCQADQLTASEQARATLRTALQPAYEILAGLQASVRWEIAPSIMALIARTLSDIDAALYPKESR